MKGYGKLRGQNQQNMEFHAYRTGQNVNITVIKYTPFVHVLM